MSAAPHPAAAWFPDPTQPGQLRWWDGSHWTEHVHAAPVAETPGPSTAAGAKGRSAELFPDATVDYGASHLLDDADVALQASATRRKAALIGAGVILGGMLITPWLLFLGIAAGIAWGVSSGYFARYQRESEARFARFCAERGLVELRSCAMEPWKVVRHDYTLFDRWISSLRAAGFDERLALVRGARGRLWAGADGGFVGDLAYRSGDSQRSLGVVAVRLPPAVTTRYGGISFEARPTGLGLGLVVERLCNRTGWRELRFELPSSRYGVRITAAPAQDDLAAWELFDPAFLESHLTRAQSLSPFGYGFVVADGHLVAWKHGTPYADAVRTVDQPDDTMAGFETWLEFARQVHARVLVERL